MQILINSKNEIISFALVGGFDNGITVEDLPNGFIDNFVPKFYVYANNKVTVNQSYKEEEPVIFDKPQTNEGVGPDEELRKLFASMQIQLVQANMMVAKLTQQNAQLSQELVKLNQEIEKIKGADENEDVIPEI